MTKIKQRITLLPMAVMMMVGLSACVPDPGGERYVSTITIKDPLTDVVIDTITTSPSGMVSKRLLQGEELWEKDDTNEVFNHFFSDRNLTRIFPANHVFKSNATVYASYIDEQYTEIAYLDGYNFKAAFRNWNKDLVRLQNYTASSSAVRTIDQSLTNPSQIEGFYTDKPVVRVSREHVWPCAKLYYTDGIPTRPDVNPSQTSLMTDIINLRACENSLNTERSDKDFADEPFPANGTSKNFWVPGVSSGEVARILFYMDCAYDIVIVDRELDPSIYSNFHLSARIGHLPDILRWSEEYPISDFEIARQDRIEDYQNNRNPFVDEPVLKYSRFDFDFYR